MTSKGLLSCRTVLWWMIFTGIAVNFMLRVNLNLVIVAVVKAPEKQEFASQCAGTIINKTTVWINESKPDYRDLPSANEHEEKRPLFSWNEYEQGLATGAYYWIHWLSEIPGGVLAKKYGTKLVFGMGNLLAVIMGFFLPIAMNHHLYSLIVIRAIQGLVAGIAYPTMHELTAQWIPQNERSKFVSAYAGAGIGIGLTYPMTGIIIDSIGWEAVFYITSVLGIIWYIFWLYCVYDTPLQHPRITSDEKNYILDNLGTSINHNSQNIPIPWRRILTSLPVWISILSNWSVCWGFFTLITEAPAYFSFVHGWSINQTGIVSGLPHILAMIYGWFFAMLSDWLLQSGTLTLTNVRKLATFGCTAGPALMVLGLSFSGCYPILAIIFNITGVAVTGSVSSGPLANLVDLSPNYASILLGICGLVVDAAGFISPIAVGLLINNNQTLDQWRLVFIITALNMIVGCIVYCFWGTAEEQPWNNYQRVVKDVEYKSNNDNIKKVEEEIPLA